MKDKASGTITDELLSPYQIEIDEQNYELVEKRTSKNGKPYKESHGYFRTLGAAIIKAARLKAIGDHDSLKAYIDEYAKIVDKMLKKLSI